VWQPVCVARTPPSAAVAFAVAFAFALSAALTLWSARVGFAERFANKSVCTIQKIAYYFGE
jgi:hypothetical protein